MKRRFLALRIISIIFKILAVVAFILMVGGIAVILIDANTYPTLQSKVQPLGIVLGSGLGGTILLLAIGQFIDLLLALETNTRATTALLQQVGKVMKERL